MILSHKLKLIFWRPIKRNLVRHVFVILSVLLMSSGVASTLDTQRFLYQPTGKFKVGFQDYHWINQHICPDPTAPRDAKKYFNQSNKKLCREIQVRIYYPSAISKPATSPYPNYIINSLKQSLLTIKQPSLKKYIIDHISELDHTSMYSQQDLPVANGSFPVIIFSPGATDNYEEYTNLLVNLASHGYVIVAINDTFLTTVTLSNGLIIPANQDLLEIKHIKTLYNIKYLDMEFVYNKINLLEPTPKSVFHHMNLDEIALLGHSAGASATVVMSHTLPNKIKAAVALDAPNQTDPKSNPNLRKANITFSPSFNIFNGFKIPFMQLHSSNSGYFLSAPDKEFLLLKNNYLVKISPSKDNKGYFKHMDYTDYALFQSLPLIRHVDQFYKTKHLNNPLFPDWGYGTISGKTAINTISQYLLAFYNTYLLNQDSKSLIQCRALTNNTIIRCGK